MTRVLIPLFVLGAACSGSPETPTPAAPAPTPAATPAVTPPAPSTPPAAAGPGDAAAGEAVYKANCTACHQADGTGMGGALGADFVNDKARLAKTDAALLGSIADGVPGTTMIAWKSSLSETQRRDVLAYIRATFGGQ